jgi:hypothetical protein
LPTQAIREKEETMVSKWDAEGGELKTCYCVSATRIETGCRPLDLLLFFGGYLATVKQVRDEVGDCSSLGLQQDEKAQNTERFIPTENKV